MAVIAALPAVGVQFWNEYDLRRARTQELEEQVLRLARLQSAEIDRLAEGARQFLVALAQIPQINSQDASACASLLARIRENYRAAYRAIIVADADGTVVCSSVGPGPGVAGQAYFRLAIQSNDFAVGNYVEDRATRAPGIHFAYPLHTQTGTISGVVAAALDLDWFAERLREKLPPNASLTVGDRAGTIVVRLPDNEARRGQPIPDEFRARLHSSAPAVTRSLGPDGIMRIVGYVPISVSENGMYVSIAREWEPAFADLNRSARRGTLIIAASFVFSLLLAWAWSEAGIRRPINRLLAVVESWRGGRFTRADHEWGRSELGRLGRAFDELAQTLGDREQELVESEHRLRDRERYLTFVFDRVPAGIMQTSPEGTYLFVNNAFCKLVGRSRDDLVGRSFSEITHPDDAAVDRARYSEAIERRRDYTHRKRYVRPDGSTVWAENTVNLLDDPDQGVIAVSVELTERMRAENQQQRLVNELNHRVKNTLASVQALMVMTNRYAYSKDALVAAFSSRLRALATTHDLLTAGLWESVSLEELVRSELAPYAGGDGGTLAISGPPLELNPSIAIGLGMIFHELATNAAKYGALSRHSGSVSVTWTVGGATPVLDIRWREHGGPSVSQPEKNGFGSHLIEQTVADWRGSFKPDFDASGFRCTISLPWG
jgi:PAS domain S-box-containing protein